jgi:hypothetical protein
LDGEIVNGGCHQVNRSVTPRIAVIDKKFRYTCKDLAEGARVAHPLPLEISVPAMILEEHKEVMRLRQYFEEATGT